MSYVRKRLIYIGLLISLALVSVTGCKSQSDGNGSRTLNESKAGAADKQAGNSQGKGKEVSAPIDEDTFKQIVLSVGSEDVYYSEAMIYFKYIESKYEAYFGSKIWDYEFDKQTFGDMAKQEILDMIVQTKIVSSQADKYNIVLTEEEELQIQQNASNFLSGLTEQDKAMYGLTEAVAQTFYRDNKLYENVYNAATMNVDTDVSDEEAEQIKIQQILVSTTETNGDGKVVPMNDKMKEKEYDKAKKLLKEARKAEDFYSFAEANTDSGQVEYTFGRGEMPEAFEKVAFSLKTGETSKIVETEEGYHILYCVSDYDEDATLEKKESVIAERQDKFFQELYKKWAAACKVVVKEKVWNAMTFSKEAVTNKTKAKK